MGQDTMSGGVRVSRLETCVQNNVMEPPKGCYRLV